jgi:hypothetical protein
VLRAYKNRVEDAPAHNQNVPRDRGDQPPVDCRPNLCDVARAKRITQKAVIKTVLNGTGKQESCNAEP